MHSYIVSVCICVYEIYIVLTILFCVFLQNGRTALHCAAVDGNAEVVDLLLSCYSDLITQTDIVSAQIIQFSIFIHDYTLMLMEVVGITAITL